MKATFKTLLISCALSIGTLTTTPVFAKDLNQLQPGEIAAHLINIPEVKGPYFYCTYRASTPVNGVHTFTLTMMKGCQQVIAYNNYIAGRGLVRILGTTNGAAVKLAGYKDPPFPKRTPPKQSKNPCEKPNIAGYWTEATGGVRCPDR